jgi:hypothetical protein
MSRMKEYLMSLSEPDLTTEPDLAVTLGMDVDILDGPAVVALIRCYDRAITDHVISYGMATSTHVHFGERITYYQARKRNLLVRWARATDIRREREPF